jgi:secondary thiamine-phosphate synthase enzyme
MIQDEIHRMGFESGVIYIFSPHTTAGIAINEGADPDVCSDIMRFLKTLVPKAWGFKHLEGNSDSHIKTAFVGSSEMVIVDAGELVLGTWQRVFFCEFDGPRNRKFFLKTIPG